jgi:ferredoxin-NADP reductase
VRSYSIASAANAENRIELTVERLPDGEVSPYLTHELQVGDLLELRGPIGGWFIWRAEQTESVQLVAGGSGIVPLMSMIRTRSAALSTAPFRLLYSIREPDTVFYRDELQSLAALDHSLSVTYVYTRAVPKNWPDQLAGSMLRLLPRPRGLPISHRLVIFAAPHHSLKPLLAF